MVVSDATPNVVTLYRGGTNVADVVVTITLAGSVRYNTGPGVVAYNNSTGIWSGDDKKLTITLGTEVGSGNTSAPTGTGADHGFTIVADAGGELASAPVAGTASRF